jgi:DNA polymerase-3 subunit delta
MTPVELQRALDSRHLPRLLYLFGEETYTRDRAAERYCSLAVAIQDRDFNYSLFNGRETRGEAVLDAARTFPVFSPQRLVLIRDAHQLADAELEKLLPYLSEPAAETCLLLVGDKIDQRKKFFQSFKKHGELVEFKKLYDNQIPSFVKQTFRECGKTFTEDALALFSRRVGNNLAEIHAELVKLATYLGEKDPADVRDVAAVTAQSKSESVFELTDALGRGDSEKGLRLLGFLLDDGNAPLMILSMMVRHYRQLWKLRELLDQGTARSELPRRAGINPYFLDGLLAQAQRLKPGRGREVFELLLETDLALKSTGSHPRPLLEALVLRLAPSVGSLSASE